MEQDTIDKENFKTTFLYKVKNSNFDSVGFTEADDYLRPFIENKHPFCFDWIYELYRENYHDEFFINNLLRTLTNILYTEITPVCIKIAEESLMRESSEIKEKAVNAFDNWGYTDAIPMLKKIHFNDPLLDNNLKWVIEGLESYKKHKEEENK
jgi:hypothetical protein